MLAIAAPRFDASSETFIRDHVRLLAPSETILLCGAAQGAQELRCPTLANLEQWDRPFSLRQGPGRLLRHAQRRLMDPGLPAAGRAKVIEFLQRHKPSALLAEYGGTGCLFADAAQAAGVPLYVHFHGHDASVVLKKWYWVRSYRRLFEKAAGIICCSHFVAGKLRSIGCPDRLLHISPGGVDMERFKPSARVPQRALAVGRLVEKKAPHLTIEAFARAASVFPAARLDIIGEGPLRGLCEATIRRCRLEGRVVMHGARSSDFVADLMGETSIFLQHSVTARNGDTEGFGISLVEAMASEVPVISTRHNGFVDTVEDGVTGFLVEERDVNAMAAAMLQLFERPDRAMAMGVAGRKRVMANFTHQQMRERLLRIMRMSEASPIRDVAMQTGRTNA
jgi:glycosyltransferase involved in cell wall biosynthesis